MSGCAQMRGLDTEAEEDSEGSSPLIPSLQHCIISHVRLVGDAHTFQVLFGAGPHAELVVAGDTQRYRDCRDRRCDVGDGGGGVNGRRVSGQESVYACVQVTITWPSSLPPQPPRSSRVHVRR